MLLPLVLSKLSTLRLKHVISGQNHAVQCNFSIPSLAGILKDMPALRKFNLSHSRMSDEDVAALVTGLKNTPQLWNLRT